MPHQKISNFTTDWNDGRLVAELVDGTAPGLCPEAYTMSADTPLENATHAMTLAEDWLGVPMVYDCLYNSIYNHYASLDKQIGGYATIPKMKSTEFLSINN